MCARSLLFQGRPRRIPGGPTVAGACAPAPSAAGSAAAVPVIRMRMSLLGSEGSLNWSREIWILVKRLLGRRLETRRQ